MGYLALLEPRWQHAAARSKAALGTVQLWDSGAGQAQRPYPAAPSPLGPTRLQPLRERHFSLLPSAAPCCSASMRYLGCPRSVRPGQACAVISPPVERWGPGWGSCFSGLQGGAGSFFLVGPREGYARKEHGSCWDSPCAEIPALLRAGPAGERALLALTSRWWLCLSFLGFCREKQIVPVALQPPPPPLRCEIVYLTAFIFLHLFGFPFHFTRPLLYSLPSTLLCNLWQPGIKPYFV